ncbi:hypothetical protein ES703_89148 [subsurface metagenome]
MAGYVGPDAKTHDQQCVESIEVEVHVLIAVINIASIVSELVVAALAVGGKLVVGEADEGVYLRDGLVLAAGEGLPSIAVYRYGSLG